MRTTRKLAAIFAVLILSLSLFCTVAYAAPEDETHTESTTPPAVSSETQDNSVIGTLPPGTGTVVDVFTDESGRLFYTIQTPAGNTFYLIIDKSKLSENVYFLDAVQESDLIALAEKAKTGGESSITETNANGKSNGESKSGNQTEPNTEPKGSTNNTMMFILVIIVLIVGGGAYFIKARKAKKSYDNRDEYENEEEYVPDDYDTEPEDDSPPWEEDEE